MQSASFEQVRTGTKRLPRGWEERLRTLGINVISYEMALAKLVTPDGALNRDEAEQIASHLDWAAQMNISLVLHLSQRMPEWALEAHAKLAAHEDETGQHGVHYDIDSPIAQQIVQVALRGLAAFLGCRENLVGFELANEPAFRTTSSSHAKEAFEGFLFARYNGDLAALRQRWAELELVTFGDAVESAWTLQGRMVGKEKGNTQPPALGSTLGKKLADWAHFNDAVRSEPRSVTA